MIPVFIESYGSEAASSAIGAGCCGLFGFMYFLIWASAIAFSVFLLVFKVMMIIDVARKHFAQGSSEQIVWILVIILVPIGSILYFFVVKRPDESSPGLKPRPTPEF